MTRIEATSTLIDHADAPARFDEAQLAALRSWPATPAEPSPPTAMTFRCLLRTHTHRDGHIVGGPDHDTIGADFDAATTTMKVVLRCT